MSIVEKVGNFQKKFEDRLKKIGSGKYGRVLKLAHRPNIDEYSKMLVISSLGILILGFIGFAIWLFMTQLVFPE